MMVFVYTSWQLMLLWRKRSGSLRTLTISTFCIITIITRCDDLQYLDGSHLPLHQIFYQLPQTLVLSICDPKEGQPEYLVVHPLNACRLNQERPFQVWHMDVQL